MEVSIVGRNIKRYREAKGLSQYQLVKLANIGVATLSDIESGKRQGLQSSTLEKISKALNISCNNLLSIDSFSKAKDLEHEIKKVLLNEQLSLDGVKLTNKEKEILKVSINAAVQIIKIQRKDE